MKRLIFLVLFFLFVTLAPQTFAQDNSFVSIVNPIRGGDFWDNPGQFPQTAVLGQIDILKKYNLSATWLLRYDALKDETIIQTLQGVPNDEKGLFLEITPTWTKDANVNYHQGVSWHSAGSAFLTGYERDEREKLIDTAFSRFKEAFGYSPKSVGAWWIDAYSLDYMQKKYGIISALIVADQYSTDNYQIWGQYFGTPYYPDKFNALHPAQNLENKIDIVMMQWATRDPVNGYGNGVMESTFSFQVNDYTDYHDLNVKYFSKLIDVYTKQKLNQFSSVVVGLENSYSWIKYANEYENQIKTLSEKSKSGQLSILSMKDFAGWYKKTFPVISPEQLIVTDDPLGGYKKAVWFMNPYYRVGWFFNQEGSVFRDIRQYTGGEEELCFKERCDSVNFATSATRVLDDVSFGTSWKIDEGEITDFKIVKNGGKFVISYVNAAGNLRKIELLPKDIGVDGKILSIDSAILNATIKENKTAKNGFIHDLSLKWSAFSILIKLIEFLIFLLLGVIFPGLVLTNKTLKDVSFLLRLFISGSVGFVALTVLFYVTGLLNIRPLIFVYILLNLIIFLRLKIYKLSVDLPKLNKPINLIAALTIFAGTVFQVMSTFRSGLTFSYGVGFWGPNSHDGVWHMALINQLIKSVPPGNPIYSGIVLKNYHYFYDLLVAATNYLSGIPVVDLIFRFYPVILSLMLGIGSYYLFLRLVNNKIAGIFSLYLIYFAGSFGWIVEFFRERHFGGESAFWANQAVSFNLNPPFAISLIIIIAFLHIIFSRSRNLCLAILLAGSLIGFKSYGAILVLTTLLLVGLFKRQWSYLIIFVGAGLLSLLIFLPNFDISANLLIFAPFWFIHSMIDSPDRVGWLRITLMREAGFAKNNWLKIFASESLSLIIFIAGNLGLRVVSLLLLTRIKSIVKNENLLFIFVFALLSFLIPILFIQSGNPWNTIQFSYYGMYVAALASGAVFYKVLGLSKAILVPFIFVLITLIPINSVVTANGYFGKTPHAFVPPGEIAGLQFLAGEPDGAILTYPYDKNLKTTISEPWPINVYDSTAYVAAFSKKAVFLEDEPQNQILLTDYKKRSVASNDFFLKPLSESTKFLQNNHIKYIYIPKIFNVRLDEGINIVKNIFENAEVVIYQVKQ